MRKLGCLLGLIGLLMLIGGFGVFGMIAVRASQANEVASIDLELGKTATTDLLTVNTDKACQVAVRISAESTSIHRGVGSNSDQEPLYDFPFSYKVLDADGKVLHSQDDSLAWNHGAKLNTRETAGPSSGTVKTQCEFDKFDVAAPGKIRVEATVQPDTKYKAEAKSLTLGVYDNVSRHGESVLGGVLLVVVGPAVAGLGLLLFIVGVARGKKAPQATQSYDPGPPMNYEIQD